jgi:cation diffusion facilitator CzcD-associated flavoprotein CzcO
MMKTTAVVIGAGHAGLAMSRRLTERSIDHIVLERAEAANSWRTQRWPSLRLLTPNSLTRPPGYDYCLATVHWGRNRGVTRGVARACVLQRSGRVCLVSPEEDADARRGDFR